MGQSRTENILENMLGASNPIPEPQSREETLLKQILESGGGGGGSSHTYSTEEHEVGKWIDGSTIYEKTLYNAGKVTGGVQIDHGITNFGKAIDYEGFCFDTQSDDIYVFPRISGDGANIGVNGITPTQVKVAYANAFQTRIYDIYVTIRYTKSES